MATQVMVQQQPRIAAAPTSRFLGISFSDVLLSFFAGCVFILFNFSGFLTYAAHTWFPDTPFAEPVVQMATWPDKLLLILNISAPDMLQELLRFSFYGIWVFLAFALLLAIRRQNVLIAVNVMLGLVAGASGIVLLAWLGVGLVLLSGLAWMVLQFLFSIWGTIVTFLVSLVAGLWGFLSPIVSFLWPIALALVVAGWMLAAIVAVFKRSRWAGVLSIAVLALVGGLIFFMRDALLPLWNRVMEILAPIGQFLGSVLGVAWEWIVRIFLFLVGVIVILGLIASGAGVVLLVVGSIGAILVDQFRTGWRSGNGHWATLFGAFSIGLALALIFWTCSGSPDLAAMVDQTWASTMPFLSAVSPSQLGDTFLPEAVRDISHMALIGIQAPLFDTLVLAIVLPLSYISLIRGLGSPHNTEVPAPFFSRNVLILGGMLVFALPIMVLTALSAAAPSEDA